MFKEIRAFTNCLSKYKKLFNNILYYHYLCIFNKFTVLLEKKKHNINHCTIYIFRNHYLAPGELKQVLNSTAILILCNLLGFILKLILKHVI